MARNTCKKTLKKLIELMKEHLQTASDTSDSPVQIKLIYDSGGGEVYHSDLNTLTQSDAYYITPFYYYNS